MPTGSPDHLKYHCPIWVDGQVNGERVRQSLTTRDLQRAAKRLAELEQGQEKPAKPLSEAITAFLKAKAELSPGTARNHRRILGHFQFVAHKCKVETLEQAGLDLLDQYRATRDVQPLMWVKELQMLLHFFRFWADREWIDDNPAKRTAMPRNIKPKPKEPYRTDEVVKVLAACDQIGAGAYERLRARAMVLLLRTPPSGSLMWRHRRGVASGTADPAVHDQERCTGHATTAPGFGPGARNGANPSQFRRGLSILFLDGQRHRKGCGPGL